MKDNTKDTMNLYKNILWATTTLVLVAAVFSLLFQTSKAPIQLSISELAGQINKGEVQKIIVQGNDLSIDLKNGDSAVTKKETELGLSQTLNNYGVDAKALQSVILEVKDQSGFYFWMGIILPTEIG